MGLKCFGSLRCFFFLALRLQIACATNLRTTAQPNRATGRSETTTAQLSDVETNHGSETGDANTLTPNFHETDTISYASEGHMYTTPGNTQMGPGGAGVSGGTTENSIDDNNRNIVTGDNQESEEDEDDDGDDGPADRYNVHGVHLPICTASCNEGCRRDYLIVDGNCACHDTCEILGSCCADYFMYCKDPPVNETSGLIYTEGLHSMTMEDFDSLSSRDQASVTLEGHMALQASDRPRTSCNRFQRNGGEKANVLVTRTCPPGHFDELCENPEKIIRAIDKYAIYYVTDGNLFSNKYCAMCNGVQLNDSSVKVGNPDFECGNSSSDAERVLRQFGYAAFEEFVLRNCTPEYHFERSHIYFAQLACPEFVDYVMYCNSSLAKTVPNYSGVDSACHSYRSDVLAYLDSGPVVYKNPHCALCNGFDNMSALTCFNQREFNQDIPDGIDRFRGSFGLPSFSLLLDFDGSYAAVSLNGKMVCPIGTYLDFVDNECVANTCPAGQILLQGNCSHLQLAPSSIIPPDLKDAYALVFQVYNYTGTEDVAAGFFKCIFENLENPPDLLNVSLDADCSLLATLQQYHGPDDNSTVDSWSNGVVCVVVTLVKHGAIDSNVFDLVESAFKLALMPRSLGFEALWALRGKFQEAGLPDNARDEIEMFRISLVNHVPKLIERPQCSAGRWTSYIDNNISLIEKSNDDGADDDTLSYFGVLWTDIGVLLYVDEMPTVISWYPIFFDPIGFWHFDLWSSYCQPNILDCERVLLEKSSVTLGQGWLKVKGYAMRIEQDMFALSDNGVFVCRSAVNEATKQKDDDRSVIEGWLTLCGITLSLIALTFTLITYSVFPLLRTVPGLGIMNLSLALFGAQLLFELAPLVANQNVDEVCIAFGAAQHYCWLAAFFWMNVLAKDTSSTFSNMMTSTSTGQKSTSVRFRVYLVYAWGLPAVLVLSCLCAYLVDDSVFDYLDLDTCWLQTGRILFLVFGLPLALIVLANIGFFTRTVIALHRAMAIADKAKSSKDGSMNYVVYMKLFALMGISWLLGFLAVLTERQEFTYMFIAVNSLQGVFICFSFALTARIRKLYRQRKFGVLSVSTTGTGFSTLTKSTIGKSSAVNINK